MAYQAWRRFQVLLSWSLNIGKLIFNSQITGSGTTPPVTPPPFSKVADVDFATSALVYNDEIRGGIYSRPFIYTKQSFYGDDSKTAG